MLENTIISPICLGGSVRTLIRSQESRILNYNKLEQGQLEEAIYLKVEITGSNQTQTEIYWPRRY